MRLKFRLKKVGKGEKKEKVFQLNYTAFNVIQKKII